MQDNKFSNKNLIDAKIKKIVDQCYQEAQKIITQNKILLNKIVTLLL